MDLKPTLEKVIQQAPATQAMLKDLKRRVSEAGAALGDIREVARLTQLLADMQWELDDLIGAVKAQASAKGFAKLAVMPYNWTPTKAQVDAFMKSPEYRAMTQDSRMLQTEKKLFQQVSGRADFHKNHCPNL